MLPTLSKAENNSQNLENSVSAPAADSSQMSTGNSETTSKLPLTKTLPPGKSLPQAKALPPGKLLPQSKTLPPNKTQPQANSLLGKTLPEAPALTSSDTLPKVQSSSAAPVSHIHPVPSSPSLPQIQSLSAVTMPQGQPVPSSPSLPQMPLSVPTPLPQGQPVPSSPSLPQMQLPAPAALSQGQPIPSSPSLPQVAARTFSRPGLPVIPKSGVSAIVSSQDRSAVSNAVAPRSSVNDTIATAVAAENSSKTDVISISSPTIKQNVAKDAIPPIPSAEHKVVDIAEKDDKTRSMMAADDDPSSSFPVLKPKVVVKELDESGIEIVADDGATEILSNPNAVFEQEDRWKSADPDSLPKPGDKFDHYEVICELGRGGFGAVYKVKNLILEREEALKLILPDAKSDVEDIDKRFAREINIVSRLEHPNVVRLYSSGKLEHNILWMSMEFIRGELLGNIMDKDGAMPFFRAKNIMLQILSGLQDAHELEIVHRDLKPSNVMISKRKGYDDLVYILDFGLSKAIGNSEDASVQNLTSTVTRSIYGTPNYMAPEQFAFGELTPSVDVYAAGIIFLELLTGQHAFTGTVFDIAIQQQTAPIPIPDYLANTAIEAVIKKACQKNALLRYQTAGEFYDALSRIQTITDSPDVLTKPIESVDHTLETQALQQPEFGEPILGKHLEKLDALHGDLLKRWPSLDRILFLVCPVLAILLLLFFIIIVTM